MNNEIKKWKIYALNKNGQFINVNWIKSTDDYDHKFFNLHHFIPYQTYTRDPQWFNERNIEQKLIYMSIMLHEQCEYRAIKNLSETEFEKTYKVPRSALVCRKKNIR